MHKKISAKGVAQIYVKKVFARHRAPNKIISDRDLKFIAAFWETFLAKQRI